jgi:hypothetical protein
VQHAKKKLEKTRLKLKPKTFFYNPNVRLVKLVNLHKAEKFTAKIYLAFESLKLFTKVAIYMPFYGAFLHFTTRNLHILTSESPSV